MRLIRGIAHNSPVPYLYMYMTKIYYKRQMNSGSKFWHCDDKDYDVSILAKILHKKRQQMRLISKWFWEEQCACPVPYLASPRLSQGNKARVSVVLFVLASSRNEGIETHPLITGRGQLITTTLRRRLTRLVVILRQSERRRLSSTSLIVIRGADSPKKINKHGTTMPTT